MEDRFPDVDWYCDYCGAYLNMQTDFSDNKYIWKSEECGRKSSISSDNIFDDYRRIIICQNYIYVGRC